MGRAWGRKQATKTPVLVGLEGTDMHLQTFRPHEAQQTLRTLSNVHFKQTLVACPRRRGKKASPLAMYIASTCTPNHHNGSRCRAGIAA